MEVNQFSARRFFQERNCLASAWMFLNILSNQALNVSYILKTFNDNHIPD